MPVGGNAYRIHSCGREYAAGPPGNAVRPIAKVVEYPSEIGDTSTFQPPGYAIACRIGGLMRVIDPSGACRPERFASLLGNQNWWHAQGERKLQAARPSQRFYFSRRQFTEPLVSTVLDSASTSKPRLSRYLSVSTEPPPIIETP